uniref:Uncharacterized protein n=1 Tax=Anguilla anguilla TaxID=7936 RepID=A0A0E9XNZ7_ANGAN
MSWFNQYCQETHTPTNVQNTNETCRQKRYKCPWYSHYNVTKPCYYKI